MKLYNVPRNTWVKPTSSTQAPPGAREVAINEKVFFVKTDGMYSYCKDQYGNIVHLQAWQDVNICEPDNDLSLL